MDAGAIENNSGEFEMTAICDIDPPRRSEAEKRFGCAVYHDYEEMLATEELDLVCVITRSDQHADMTRTTLEAGVNVLVTKPWAVNSAEAEGMIDSQIKSGKKLLPWLPARWGSDLSRLKELLAANTVGNVFLVRRSVCSFGTRNDWQMQRKYGGGYLLNWGAHIVDPPIVLLDSPVKSVYARMKQTINPGDAEDLFMAILTLENGSVVQAEYTVAVEDLPTWFIQGDRGTIVVNGKDITVHGSTPAQPDDPTQYKTMKSQDERVESETVGPGLYGDETTIYGEIATAIRGETEYPVKPEDALALTRVFDAIRTAADENRVVSL